MRAKRTPPRIRHLPGQVYLYADGACHPNASTTNFGGWGTLLMYGQDALEISGGERNTTNNRMELLAILRGLEALHRPWSASIVVVTDSKYCVHSLGAWWVSWERRGWRTANGGEPRNLDLIQAVVDLQREAHAAKTIRYQWVPGHAGHEHNERVDQLAVEARVRLKETGRCDERRVRRLGNGSGSTDS